MTTKFENAIGKVFYGMHFYPGVAEYAEPNKEPYRIFINEDTIRSMSPTFPGRPIFVEHVDEVTEKLEDLKKEADGWVIESFYNAADGKTWAKFIVVSDRGLEAIRKGYKLSNAYIPRSFKEGGLWNGVSYAREVTSGEFDHLAIVQNPRYEESEILTPDEFKLYNSEKEIELKKLANSKDEKGDVVMWFKKTKVENAKDFEGMSVTLPKSKKDFTLVQLVEEMDKIQNMQGYASDDHMVKVGDEEMSVKNLVKKHMKMNEEMKKNEEMDTESDVEADKKDVDVEGDLHNEEDEDKEKDKKKENEEDDDAEEKKKKENEEDEDKKDEKKKNSSKKNTEHFDRLKNAHNTVEEEVARVDLMEDQVARGRARYGS